MPAGEADLGDRGVRVSLRQLLTEPGGLRHVAAVAQEQVEVLNPLAREDPLVADVLPHSPLQPAQQLDLLLVARCEVRVARLRCDRVIPPSVPVEDRLTQPRAGRDDGGVPPGVSRSGMQRLEVLGREAEHSVGRCLEIVEEPHARYPHRPG